MTILDIIEKKRDKKELEKEEIEFFVNGYTKGEITDYQASALVMAIYINGMTNEETTNLTLSMAHSGEILDLSKLGKTIVDKHSTGGVGDKVSLILLPLVASFGVPVAKMSGRGLGFTGGTVDKLESIPGYKTDIDINKFVQNVENIGISMISQTLNLAPADKKLYSLRDSIACVESIPLIASSIMSKKIASGADKIVLDNGDVVADPVGNLSSSFTISAQVILAQKDYVRQLHNIFKKAGLEIDGIVPTTLAERNLVLDKNELHDNVMILDIGAGNTDIGVFEGSSFIYTNSIPVGGDNITNDIAVVLNISEEEADKLKRQYGLALKSYIDNDNDIILNTSKDDNKNRIIKSSELIEIIEARIEEIFSIINKDITNQGIKSKINNVVLTGQGIVNISKSDVAGKINLNIPVKISTGRAISTVKSTYRTSYALVRYIAARPFAKTVSSSIDTQSNESFIKTILERIKEFFYS